MVKKRKLKHCLSVVPVKETALPNDTIKRD